MGTEAAGNSQSVQQKTKLFNVTDLTLRQKHGLFICCFAEEGFVGFDKQKVGDQTYYVFTYRNKAGNLLVIDQIKYLLTIFIYLDMNYSNTLLVHRGLCQIGNRMV